MKSADKLFTIPGMYANSLLPLVPSCFSVKTSERWKYLPESKVDDKNRDESSKSFRDSN